MDASGKKIQKIDEQLDAEDTELRNQLDGLMKILLEEDRSGHRGALEELKKVISASTAGITAVPKPLKLMIHHYKTLKDIHGQGTLLDTYNKRLCADILSALGMMGEGERECLKYRLIGHKGPIGVWGQEYVRHLTKEFVEEWKLTEKGETSTRFSTLIPLSKEILVYDMEHGCETEACDLLIEIRRLDLLLSTVSRESAQDKICRYLLSCAPYTEGNASLLKTTRALYSAFGKEIDALRCSMMMNSVKDIKKIFFNSSNRSVQKQMALLLGRHQIFIDIPPSLPDSRILQDLHSNSLLHAHFLALAAQLDILEPKTPADIYKSPVMPKHYTGGSWRAMDSSLLNVASSFVNGLVNAGFGKDKLMTDKDGLWLKKNTRFGVFMGAASLGLIHRWDLASGLNHCADFLYQDDDYIKGGTLLGIGMMSNGVEDSDTAAEMILSDYVNQGSDKTSRIGAILGLGLAYANSYRPSVIHRVIPRLSLVLTEKGVDTEVLGLAGLSLGLICVGTGDGGTAEAIHCALLNQTPDALNTDHHLRFLALGIALIYLSRQEEGDEMRESLGLLPGPFGRMAVTLLTVCAYAGTGDVLKIQELLQMCAEHRQPPPQELSEDEEAESEEESGKEKKRGVSISLHPSSSSLDSTMISLPLTMEDFPEDMMEEEAENKMDMTFQQAVGVVGIALICMGEEVGSTMAIRTMGHLIRSGDVSMKRAVPLALGLLSVSNPQLIIVETLSKYSHDFDPETALNSIFALGLIGAGTNNARLNSILHQLAEYYAEERCHLMVVRVAQGMVRMGKGSMTLSPFHSDRQLMSPSAVAGLLATCLAFLDVRKTILSETEHYLLFCLVPGIQPRLLLTFLEREDGCMVQINVLVRVGQAVDVVGQAGQPKMISGFQTHTTPVLLGHGERAELVNDEFLSMTPHLEGLVILKRNFAYKGSFRTQPNE